MAETKTVVEPQTTGTETQTKTTVDTQTTSPDTQTTPSNTQTKTDDKSKKDDEGLLVLDKGQLIDIIHDTRGEAGKRRHHERELEGNIKTFQSEIELNKQKELEAKEEWETAFKELKEKTKNFGELKDFKEAFIKECATEIDKLTPNLTKTELELFELSKDKMQVNDQILFIKKLVENRPSTTTTDNTQSNSRTVKQEEEGKVPFGNIQTVIGKVMESLKLQRKK